MLRDIQVKSALKQLQLVSLANILSQSLLAHRRDSHIRFIGDVKQCNGSPLHDNVVKFASGPVVFVRLILDMKLSGSASN